MKAPKAIIPIKIIIYIILKAKVLGFLHYIITLITLHIK